MSPFTSNNGSNGNKLNMFLLSIASATIIGAGALMFHLNAKIEVVFSKIDNIERRVKAQEES